MSRTTQILMDARAKVSRPDAWTQGNYARDAGGAPVDPQDRFATCFCMVGALRAVCNDAPFGGEDRGPSRSSRKMVMEGIRHVLGHHVATIPEFNDRESTTHADVLAAFDYAIDLSKNCDAHQLEVKS